MSVAASASGPRVFTESTAFVILMGALAAFDPLSIDMYLPSFPSIQRDLHASYAAVELSLSAFFIGMASGQLVYGPLADRFGRRRPLVGGMILYMLGAVGCAFAANIPMLVACRVLQAFGGCAGMVITRAVVRDLFEKKRAAHFFSMLTLVMGLAPILAPLAGGWVDHALGWRAIFGILAAANLVCLGCILAFLPETHRTPNRALGPATVLRDYASLFRDRSFIGFVIPDAAVRAGMFAYIAGSPFVFIELFRVAPEHYGWIFGSNAFGLIGGTQLNRLLLKRSESERILARVVPLTAFTGLVLVALTYWSGSAATFFPPLFLFIASLGFIGPNALACALSRQGHRAGTASALYGTLQWSVASFSSFLVSRLHDGTALPMTAVMCGCGLVSLAAFTVITPRRERGG